MGALASIQQGYSRFDPDALAPLSAPAATRGRDGGVTTYRNLAGVSLVDVLDARFPVIRRLVGDESFRAMVRRYIAGKPLRAATLRDYGETFPRFIRSQGKAASIEYVADIAELEMLRDKACRAAEARPLSARALGSLRTRNLDALRLVLHPSAFLVASRFPIVTIWENNRCDDSGAMIERWRAESALVARPFLDVEVRRLPGGGYPFIGALSKGRTIAAAMRAGTAAAQDFDIDCNLRFLVDAKIIVGIGEDA